MSQSDDSVQYTKLMNSTKEGKVPEQNELNYNEYRGLAQLLVKFIAAGLCLFCLLYISGALPSLGIYFINYQFNSIFLSGILVLTFLLIPARKNTIQSKLPWYDIVLIIGSLAGTIYIMVNAIALAEATKLEAGTAEIVLGLVTCFVILEAVRRTIGWPMVIITLGFLLFAKFGYLLPSAIGIYPQTWARIVSEIYLSFNGMFGSLTELASSIIFAFIAFGTFFVAVGGGNFFLDLALSAAGRFRGGPAKVCILGSATFGMLSGSPIANAAVTGCITIPLMKKTGYTSVFAGAVEATAATGGMIMPPVMGTVAFLMADFLEMSYATIALVAIVPALMYFLALYTQTDLRSIKDRLVGMPPGELPSVWATLKGGWEFIIPLVVLVLLLFVLRYPASMAAVDSIVVLIVVSLFRKKTRLNLNRFIGSLEKATKSMLTIAPICAAAGIIISTMAITGLGPKITTGLVAFSGGNLLVLLIIAALACYIMGMGVSISATYILLAALIAPALVAIGIPKLQSHFFLLYMGMTFFISPPFCPAVFVTAGIADAPVFRTGLQAVKLGIVCFIVPFAIMYNPGLLLVGNPANVLLTVVTTIIGIFALAVGIEGYLFHKTNWLQRILFIGSGISLISPWWMGHIIGICILAAVIFWQRLVFKKAKSL